MRYLVQAVRGGNEVSTLEVEAPDQASLATHADLRGWKVLAVTPQQFGLPDLLRFKPGAKFPVLLFSRRSDHQKSRHMDSNSPASDTGAV